MKALVLASLNYYCGRMSGDGAFFAAAAKLDPAYSAYRLWHAKHLAASRETAAEALALLSGVVREILYAPEAWSLMQATSAQHGIAITDAEALEAIVTEMEERTLIDEYHTEIRVGRYGRSQRQNAGLDYLKKSDRADPPRLSVLLADTNGTRYETLLNSLGKQTLDRQAYEIVLCDVFDRVSPRALDFADIVIRCGQDEHLYNRNAAFNAAFLASSGSFILMFGEDCNLPDGALETVLGRLQTDGDAVFVNEGGTADSRDSVCIAALSRNRLIEAGGLSESAYHAGAFGGPHEVTGRLRAQHIRIVPLDGLPRATLYAAAARHAAVETMCREIWPDRFSPHRALPLLENREIAKLRSER